MILPFDRHNKISDKLISKAKKGCCKRGHKIAKVTLFRGTDSGRDTYRVSGHNGQVFDGNFLNLRERCVKTEVM